MFEGNLVLVVLGANTANLFDRAPGRTLKVTPARHAAAWILKERGASFPQVSRWLKRRCHSTAINSWQRFPRIATAEEIATARLIVGDGR